MDDCTQQTFHIIPQLDNELVSDYVHFHNSAVIVSYIVILSLAVFSIFLIVLAHKGERLTNEAERRKNNLFIIGYGLAAFPIMILTIYGIIHIHDHDTEVSLKQQVIERNVQSDNFDAKDYVVVDDEDKRATILTLIDHRDVSAVRCK